MKKVRIGEKLIGEGEPTFVIAEAGSNHDRKIKQAKKLIDVAAEAGADAVKFQIFSAEKMVAKTSLDIDRIGEKTVYEILKNIEFSCEWLQELYEYARKKDIVFLSSTFDREGVDLLDETGVPAFKIASGEINNFPLLKYTAEKGKPLIVSTGMSTIGDVEEAISVIQATGNEAIILLHCVASYPTPIEDVNLRSMLTLQRTFQFPVGFSDHTLDTVAPLVAVAMGAVMIEKHFTINKKLPGPDHFYSLEPQELKTMVKNIRVVEKMMGSPIKQPIKAELEDLYCRRSIFAKVDIPAGVTITEDMLTILRPSIGLEPKYISVVIGRKARIDIKRFEPITWNKI